MLLARKQPTRYVSGDANSDCAITTLARNNNQHNFKIEKKTKNLTIIFFRFQKCRSQKFSFLITSEQSEQLFNVIPSSSKNTFMALRGCRNLIFAGLQPDPLTPTKSQTLISKRLCGKLDLTTDPVFLPAVICNVINTEE